VKKILHAKETMRLRVFARWSSILLYVCVSVCERETRECDSWKVRVFVFYMCVCVYVCVSVCVCGWVCVWVSVCVR